MHHFCDFIVGFEFTVGQTCGSSYDSFLRKRSELWARWIFSELHIRLKPGPALTNDASFKKRFRLGSWQWLISFKFFIFVYFGTLIGFNQSPCLISPEFLALKWPKGAIGTCFTSWSVGHLAGFGWIIFGPACRELRLLLILQQIHLWKQWTWATQAHLLLEIPPIIRPLIFQFLRIFGLIQILQFKLHLLVSIRFATRFRSSIILRLMNFSCRFAHITAGSLYPAETPPWLASVVVMGKSGLHQVYGPG